MKRFRSNWDAVPSYGEINRNVSITIPGQAMSAEEVLRRWRNGLPLELSIREQIWDDDSPDIETMDFVDREAYIEEIREKVESLEKAENEKRELEQKEAYDKKFKSAVEAEIERRAKARAKETFDSQRQNSESLQGEQLRNRE